MAASSDRSTTGSKNKRRSLSLRNGVPLNLRNRTGNYYQATLDATPFPSSRNSVSGVINREKPQSKQIETLGHTKMPGLSMFLRPLRWMFISAVNSCVFECGQSIIHFSHLDWIKRVPRLADSTAGDESEQPLNVFRTCFVH
jgi:hypothetical protein